MALALNNLKRVDMPFNKETKPCSFRPDDCFFFTSSTSDVRARNSKSFINKIIILNEFPDVMVKSFSWCSSWNKFIELRCLKLEFPSNCESKSSQCTWILSGVNGNKWWINLWISKRRFPGFIFLFSCHLNYQVY